MYRSVFDAKWRPESSLVLFLIKPAFLQYSFISDHKNNKCICLSNMFLSWLLLMIGVETFWIN